MLKALFGYSDVSVLLNPLQDFGDVPVFYLQARFLASCSAAKERFARWIQQQDDALFRFHYAFCRAVRSPEGSAAAISAAR